MDHRSARRRWLTLLAAALVLAGCGSGTASAPGGASPGAGGGTTTSTSTTTTTTTTVPGFHGVLRVAILSHNGPYGSTDRAVAATSLAGARAMANCPSCWSDAVVAGSQLLIGATVEACKAVESATGALVKPATLLVDVHHALGNGPDVACTGTVPRLWLFAVPLASLPQHVTLTVEVEGGQSVGRSFATTTVRLP